MEMNLITLLIRLITRYPIITLFFVVVITAIAIIPACRFNINTDIQSFFDSSDPDVKAMNEIKKQFGLQEVVTIVVDASRAGKEQAEAYMEKLVARINQDKRYINIEYLQDLSFARDNFLLYLSKENLLGLSSPFHNASQTKEYLYSLVHKLDVPNYIVSEKGDLYLVNLRIDIDITDFNERNLLFHDLENLIEIIKAENPDFKELLVGFTGSMPVLAYESDKIARQDFFRTFSLTFLMVLIILFIFFRKFSIVILSILPLLVGIAWTSGVVLLIYPSLNLFAFSFAVLILGVGVDFSIHLLSRIHDLLKGGVNVQKAIEITYRHTGKAVFLGCLTTATAFFSLTVAESEPVHQLGVVGGIGLILTLMAVILIIPPMTAISQNIHKTTIVKSEMSFLVLFGRKIQLHAKLIVCLLVVLSIFLIIRSRNVTVIQTNLYDMMPKEMRTSQNLEKVKNNFSYNPDVLLTQKASKSELIDLIDKLEKKDEVIRVESILNFLPEDLHLKLSLIKNAIKVHPELGDMAMFNLKTIDWHNLPKSIKDRYVSKDGKFLARMAVKGDLYDRKYRYRLIADLRTIEPSITCEAQTLGNLIDTFSKDVKKISLMAVLIIFFIIYIGMGRKNPFFAFLSLVPIGFGILGLMGTHRWLGADLNLISIALIPLILGIGIDDGIHIVHRYLENNPRSITKVVQSTGKAIFFTTATTCIAFGSLLISTHPTIRDMALVPIIGITYCFVGAILFLPALLHLIFDKDIPKK